MEPTRLRWAGSFVVVVMLGISAMANTGCGFLGFGASCDGASGLKQEHRELLDCAGWLSLVEDHVGTIEYFDEPAVPNTDDAAGQTFCRSCRVEVSTQTKGALPYRFEDRTIAEVVSIIVHEATHLEEDCAEGEANAVAAEARFMEDVARLECVAG